MLYHGSDKLVKDYLKPILLKDKSEDYIHSKAAVFATERLDLAALFILPQSVLSSIGFEKNIAYVCIWGKSDNPSLKKSGFIYVLPAKTFQKIGKDYEWQSFEPVKPLEIKKFKSAINGMMACGVQVYFIEDEEIFDEITVRKSRVQLLKKLISENQKRDTNIKEFK